MPDTQSKLEREELEKKARERRDALEILDLLSLPVDGDSKLPSVKPGHWIETQQKFKSNREDLQVVVVGGVERGTELARIPGTDVINEYTRRTSLPKGQTKTVDLNYFIPFSGKQDDPYDFSGTVSSQLKLRTELLSWPLMTPISQAPGTTPANELKDHEYQLCVLSPQPLGYEFLTVLDAVYWRGDDLMQDDRVRSYFVSLVKPVDNKYPFPTSMLTMTSMAVMVWDDVSVDSLSFDQQNAIVDWLHWGGQLIINGPNSWSRLQSSFLSPYLPATSAETAEFNSVDFAEISKTWVTRDREAPGKIEPLEIVGPSVSGLKFSLNERGGWLPGSGELVAESSVGRGRIVLTAFSLREPRINRWKYFSSFFSSGLLRRAPRTILLDAQTRSPYQTWAPPYSGRERDARMHSNLRILSRDLPLSNPDARSASTAPDATTLAESQNAKEVESQSEIQFNSPGDQQSDSREEVRWGGSSAAWNDFSGFSFEVLAALKSAAGIELPSRQTILYLLAGYLAILVPVNWVVFKLIGRLEYAWLAAPVLALLGVVVVTKVARLDIGFARRTTEISLLELHGAHPRGHLTQYIALYTSLSTNYAIEFPENGSVALPLGDIAHVRRRAVAEVRNLRTNYGRSDGVTLEPLTVYSNSTEMIHAEQMVNLEGSLLLGATSNGQDAVKNETGLNLKGAVMVRCASLGDIEVSWVGDLETGKSAPLVYTSPNSETVWDNWNRNLSTQLEKPLESRIGEESLWIGGLLRELVHKTPLVAGQTRLIAYTDDRPGDLKVTPSEDQFDGRCVVVAHLSPARLGDVKPDVLIMSRSGGVESVAGEEQGEVGSTQTDPTAPPTEAAEIEEFPRQN